MAKLISEVGVTAGAKELYWLTSGGKDWESAEAGAIEEHMKMALNVITAAAVAELNAGV
jgi:hypothetical protein